MKKSIAVSLLLITVLSGFSATAYDYSENIELHKGEEIDLNNLTLSYTETRSESRFKIGYDNGETIEILETMEDEEIFSSKDNSFRSERYSIETEILDVKSDDEGLYLDLHLSSSEDIFADAELDSSAPDRVFIGQGEEQKIPLTLENTGAVDQEFELEVEHNSSIESSFNYQDFNITSVNVEAGEEKSLSAEIDVPNTADTGVYELELAAEGRSKASEKMTLDVRESQDEDVRRSIRVSPEESYMGVKPGKSVTVPVRIRNTGTAALENIELDITAPENWDKEVSRKSFRRLERYGSARTQVTLEAPANAETGDHFLEVSAHSEDTKLDQPERVRLTIQEESNLRYIGLGIMVLSLGSLVAVYRKLGRR